MIDREKAIEDLQYLHDRETWKEGIMSCDDHASDRKRITERALELLKEQEPIEPSICGTPGGYSSWWYLCGKCKKPIDRKDRFCKRCGQAVKWDE